MIIKERLAKLLILGCLIFIIGSVSALNNDLGNAVNFKFPTSSSSSSGSVSRVTSSLGSLSISPTVGAVSADINEAYSNNWTTPQYFNSETHVQNLFVEQGIVMNNTNNLLVDQWGDLFYPGANAFQLTSRAGELFYGGNGNMLADPEGDLYIGRSNLGGVAQFTDNKSNMFNIGNFTAQTVNATTYYNVPNQGGDISYYHLNSSTASTRRQILGAYNGQSLTSALFGTSTNFIQGFPYITGQSSILKTLSITTTGNNASCSFKFALYNSSDGNGNLPFNLIWNSSLVTYMANNYTWSVNLSVPKSQVWYIFYQNNKSACTGGLNIYSYQNTFMSSLWGADASYNLPNGGLTVANIWNDGGFPNIINSVNVSTNAQNTLAVGATYA